MKTHARWKTTGRILKKKKSLKRYIFTIEVQENRFLLRNRTLAMKIVHQFSGLCQLESAKMP